MKKSCDSFYDSFRFVFFFYCALIWVKLELTSDAGYLFVSGQSDLKFLRGIVSSRAGLIDIESACGSIIYDEKVRKTDLGVY